MENTVENSKLCCQICGLHFTEITNTHLKGHGISLEDYKINYGIVSLKKGKTWEDRFGVQRSIKIKEKARDAKDYKLFSKDLLEELYWHQEKPLSKIAEDFGISVSMVLNAMKRFDIHRRNYIEASSGLLNGMFGKHHSDSAVQLIRKTKIGRPNPYAKGNKHFLGRQHTPEWKKNMSGKTEHLWKRPEFRAKHVGENHPGWMGGITKYPSIFKLMRKSIIERDGHTCQLCFTNNNLLPHHIDYNTKNNHSKNLITLCSPCNVKVNYNRQYWMQYFLNLMKMFVNIEDDINVRTGCQSWIIEHSIKHSTWGL